jgi:hypothetical protein
MAQSQRQALCFQGGCDSTVRLSTLTAFGGFYTRIAPPQDSLRFWPGYAALVAGVAFILISNVKDSVRSVILWISIIPAVACPALYYMKYQTLTASYGESQVINGTVYTRTLLSG